MLTPVLGGDFRPQLEPVSKICSFSIDLRYVVFFFSLFLWRNIILYSPPQKKKTLGFSQKRIRRPRSLATLPPTRRRGPAEGGQWHYRWTKHPCRMRRIPPWNHPRSPLKGDVPNKYPLCKVYMELIIFILLLMEEIPRQTTVWMVLKHCKYWGFPLPSSTAGFLPSTVKIPLPETNVARETGWFKDYFPFGKAYFQRLC